MDTINADIERDIETSNEEIFEDIPPIEGERIVVYSRDWTIETIFNQIELGNIDLNPKFQRRNAWKDDKKSRLIESFLLGLPVPQIVLAEDKAKLKSFIVIDGKQRLITIAGFMDPIKYNYWKNNQLSNLKSRADLNGVSYQNFKTTERYSNEYRSFLNSDIRCTIISNYSSIDVLYDVFYRLNTGSVTLSTQELRQVLHKGPFADYLYEITTELQPIHEVIGLTEPDPRLYDMEFLLRFISLYFFGKEYKGNLKAFLDNSMGIITKSWDKYQNELRDLYTKINEAITKLHKVFGKKNVGKRYSKQKYTGFNKAIFEVQLFYFIQIPNKIMTLSRNKHFKAKFENLSTNDTEFNDTITASTKDVAKYRKRYDAIKNLVNEVYNLNLRNTILRN